MTPDPASCTVGVLTVAAAHSTGFVQEALTMQVRNLMRSPVVTVDPDQSLQHAAQVMQEHGIGSVSWSWAVKSPVSSPSAT